MHIELSCTRAASSNGSACRSAAHIVCTCTMFAGSLRPLTMQPSKNFSGLLTTTVEVTATSGATSDQPGCVALVRVQWYLKVAMMRAHTKLRAAY